MAGPLKAPAAKFDPRAEGADPFDPRAEGATPVDAAGAAGPKFTATPGAHDQSLWEQANTGIVTPEQVGSLPKKIGSAVMQAFGSPQESVEPNVADYDTLKSERDYFDPNETPIHAAVRRGIAGAGTDAADTLSSFTSPLSIATAGMGRLAKAPGAVGKVARAVSTATGIGYGIKGASDMNDALSNEKDPSQDIRTPDNMRKFLLGASQVTGAAPAVAEAGRVAANTGKVLAPKAYAEGEEAFVRAMNPPKRGNEANILRQSYRTVAPDLEGSGAKSFEDLQNFARKQKIAAATETNRRLALTNAPPIDPNAVEAAVRSGVTDLMDVESTNHSVPSAILNAQGQPAAMHNVKVLPPRAQGIIDYARNVGENLARSPKGLVEAEQLVQDINAEGAKYQRMTPDAQRQADAEGQPMAAKLALKDELQRQIDQHVANYPDLKRRYGAFKEIEKNSQRRLNEIETQPPVSYPLRKGLEYGAGALGAMLGASHGGYSEAGLGAILGGVGAHAAADFYSEKLANSDRMLRRGMKAPKVTSPTDFNGALVQPVASGILQQQDNERFHTPIHSAAGIGDPLQAKIRVIHPQTGETGTIPAEDLNAALKQGYKKVGN